MAAWSITEALREADSAWQVLTLVFQHEASLNAIHVTAAATRLAAFTPCDVGDEPMLRFLTLLRARASSLDARGVANVLWALGKLSSRLPPGSALCGEFRLAAYLLQAVCIRHLSQFTPQHLSNMLWSLAVMPGEACPWEASTLEQLLQAAAPLMHGFTPQGLSNVLWSCAKLAVTPNEAWLSAFYTASRETLRSWPGQSVSTALWALARLGVAAPPRDWLLGLCKQTEGRLSSFDCQALANTAWALAVLQRGEQPCMARRPLPR